MCILIKLKLLLYRMFANYGRLELGTPEEVTSERIV